MRKGCASKRSRGQDSASAGNRSFTRTRSPVVQEAFTPSDEEIDYARRVVETFESSQREGKGAYALDGKMIDMPLLKNARKCWNGHEKDSLP
jgi:hypothetical protein